MLQMLKHIFLSDFFLRNVASISYKILHNQNGIGVKLR